VYIADITLWLGHCFKDETWWIHPFIIRIIATTLRYVYVKNTVITLVLATRLSALEVLHNIYNMGTYDFPPDMYACSAALRLCPRALGMHIRQITRAHVTTIK